MQKLKEHAYQLVVLDVMMPGMDGFETLEEIRQKSSLLILMLTSKNDSISKVRGLRAGADDYLYCAKHQGKILTKRQIYEEVWGEEYFYDDSNIMAIISRLRKKLEVNPSSPKYIQTVKGIGYRFNKEV